MAKHTAVGVVTSDKMQKTRKVELPRRIQHPKYGKVLKRQTVCFVHDPNEESHLGDLVEIEESTPLSKRKRWMLLRIVKKSTAIQVATAEPAAKG
jgi:small subunit ribosomal protein S17